MKKEQIDKDLILSLTNEMKLAGVPAFPFSAEYKELYSCLFSGLNLPLFIVEPHTGRILDANYAAGTMFNCTNDTLRLITINSLFTGPTLDDLFEELQKNKNFPARLALKHKNNNISYADTFSGYINIKGKKVVYICVENFSNKSGLICNQEPVDTGNKEAMVLTGLSGKVFKINEAFITMLGYEENEIKGNSIKTILPGLNFPPDINTNTNPLLLKSYKKNGSPVYIETRHEHKAEIVEGTGGYAFYIKEILPEDIIKNEILWLSDVLEESDETNILTHLNRYKSFINQGNYLFNKEDNSSGDSDFNKMIASANNNKNEDIKIKSISHEFRTLMNIIMGFSEILRIELSNKDQVEMVNYIADSSMKLMTISSVVIKLLQERTKQNKE